MPRPAPKKRLISKRTAAPRARTGSSRKEMTELAGNFQTGARREEIVRAATKGKQAPLRCRVCGSVYHDKHWHSAAILNLPNTTALAVAREVYCDECSLELRKSSRAVPYSGEVIITGDFSSSEKMELLNLVRNVGHRAMKRDPLDRIIRIEDVAGNIHVYVSENQLAVSIGKQVDRSHKGGELEITWSKSDKPVRVHWTKGMK